MQDNLPETLKAASCCSTSASSRTTTALLRLARMRRCSPAMSWEASLERLARLGYVCKGIVYVVVGLLAAATITGNGAFADRQDAFTYIFEKPFGRVLLLIMAVGLTGYAAWRVCSAIADSEQRGTDLKGIAMRTGSVIRGLFYGSIATELAVRVLRHGAGGKSSDSEAKHWASRTMDRPFGRWLLAFVGISIVGYALYQLVMAVKGKLSKQIRTAAVAPWLIAISRFGLGARAVVFAVIGGSLIRAAIHYSPNQARGTTGAMRALAGQPYGMILLALTGIGLASYGVYSFVNARYRQMEAT
jgi:hypothetical protein